MIPPSPAFISLLNFVDAQAWQRIQEHLAHVLAIPIRTIGFSHELFVQPSWPANLMNDSVIALLQAGEELDQLLPVKSLPQELTSITTAIGVTYSAVPIRATPETLSAYVVLGPIIVGVREDEIEFKRRVNQLGLDAAVLWPVLLSLKLYSFNSLRAVMALIEEVGNLLAAQGYKAKPFEPVEPLRAEVEAAAS